MGADLSSLAIIPEGVHTRWASPESFGAEKGAACRADDGRKRSAFFKLAAGESRTLLDVNGTAGTVRRIWVTINDRDARALRGIRLDVFWDGAAAPAVSGPIGDLFGHCLGRMATFQSALFSSPEGRSFNCCIPMPFRSGARAVVTNESGRDLAAFYYDIDLTVGDRHVPDAAYFHAHWRRENPTTPRSDYALLPALRGRGRYLGCHVGVIADTGRWFRTWWGEGEVKCYLDGDSDHATLCGTGTEDYIGTGWGQGQYAHLYQGCHQADHDAFRYGFYRLHVPDPIYFHREARVTIQQIGCWSPETITQLRGVGAELEHGAGKVDMATAVKERGYGLFERADDWSSCAYFYLDRPDSGLPALAPVDQRIAGLV
jgi:hypothetical protein